MQIKTVLFLVVVGAVAVLAKKGSSEEVKNAVPVLVYPNVDSHHVFVVSGVKGNRKPGRYPKGRPFQVQQQLEGFYPQPTSFYPQQPGMQQPPYGMQGAQRPFGQNSFPSSNPMSTQQYPNSFATPNNYPPMGPGASRPFYAGSGKPNQFIDNQYGRFPGNSQFPAPSQFPGSSQFPTAPQVPGGSQFPGPSQFPKDPQFSSSSRFPATPQYPGNAQFSVASTFPGNSKISAGSKFSGYGSVQVWPFNRPGRGPKPFKFKGPKHQIYVIGRPQYPQQQYYPQEPQIQPQYQPQYQPQFQPQFQPQYPPQYPAEQQGMSSAEVQQYLEGIDRRMQEASANAYKAFQKIENEIDGSRRNLESIMKSQFQTLEVALEAKQAKEFQQAVKEGKDETKLQECLAEEERATRAEMDADIQRTLDCMNDATERARKVLNEARNAYTETSYMSSLQAKEWAQKIRFCNEQRNNKCVEEGMALINEKTKSTVEEGNERLRNLQDAPRQQMIQMKYCRQNFMDDLKDMREAYSKMVKRCVIASEIQDPEEEYDEEEEEEDEKENLSAKVETKPAFKPAFKPIIEPIVKPIVEPIVKPIVESVVKPEAEAETEAEVEA